MQTINNRIRDKTFASHVTDEERSKIEAHILISERLRQIIL